MKRARVLNLFFLIFGAALIISCSDDDDDAVEPFKATQGDLDLVANFIGDFTGGNMAHGGPDGTSPDSTVREVFASRSLSGDIPVGTIVTKNTYKRGADGKKTDKLYVSFAMIKREAGYDSDNGNWEYVKIAYDESVDYKTHPYGKLPSEGENRGKLSSCIGCHSGASGGDYLFVND